MVILVLVMILAGSLAGSLTLWLQDAGIWAIMLGYVAGGWVGLLVGLPLIFLVRAVTGLRRPRPRLRQRAEADQAAVAPSLLET